MKYFSTTIKDSRFFYKRLSSIHAAKAIFSGVLIVTLFWVNPVRAQQGSGIAELDSLLAAENYAAADSALQLQITHLKAEGKLDSLAYYPYYVGKVAQLYKGGKPAVKAVDQFINYIKKGTSEPAILRQMYLELASFYGLMGRPADAYTSNKQARAQTLKMDNRTDEDLGVVERNMSVLARQMGDISLAIEHNRNALRYFEQYEDTEEKNYYLAYNGMGAMMWFSSKIDSALYYYEQALKMLNVMEATPINRLYRPANVLNNKAALYSLSGQTTKALETMKIAVKDYSEFLDAEGIADSQRESTRQNLFRSIENLGGIYKELGNFTKTRELLEYSYEQKKTYLPAESPELFKSEIMLGQIELALRNHGKALEYLNDGIRHIERLPEQQLFWHAEALESKALLYDEQNQPEKAAAFYKQAEARYEQAYGGVYDAVFLEFLANMALFYAENGDDQRALQKAEKAYQYVVKHQGKHTMMAFKHRLNRGLVYYALGRYKDAAEESRQSLAILQDKEFRRNNLIDSVQVEFKKPDAILLRVKSEYQMSGARDTTFLLQQLNQLDSAFAIIDKRKAMLSAEEDLNVQIANNTELFEFAKKIALELYQKTGNKKYLDQMIGYHESGLYNRIRARLNAQKAMQFAHIPPYVFEREKELKAKIEHQLGSNHINGYLQANSDWETFLDTLKSEYPRYFTLRYGSVTETIDQIAALIPDNTTVVRYFFVSQKLYALLLDQTEKKLIELAPFPVGNHIRRLWEHPYDAEQTGGLLHDLYTLLWQPLAADLDTRRVIIIPDGELFNLSFETLVTAPVTSFADLAENSLLARHAISYQYSLLLLDNIEKRKFQDDFIGFAPGFDEVLKQQYEAQVKDSLFFDRTYMTLLAQPFTVDLIAKLNRYFGGRIYTGSKSTEGQFTATASGHQIIHIGTHAESNNLNPERSRLFFAKDTDSNDPDDDNSLYAWEIYNYDLTSNLTLLTACETGKPRYQPGEGMISLAHAFNYAGSQSLLTGLWNIDEKASAQIVDRFYQNLANGKTKDVALQQAKLSYLAAAEGRTAAPQYWAGLVLLGDASAIPINKSSLPWSWLIAGMILFAASGTYFLVNRKWI